MGEVVIDVCLQFLNGEAKLLYLNRTNVVLIPKKKVPKRVADFRPISLSNVLDRIVCKAIANRLKQILPSVISGS